MKDRAAKSAYDKARYAARHVDRRATVCVASGCQERVLQPVHGRRLYHDDACKMQAFHVAHAAPAYEPIPQPYTGHQWLEAARVAVGAQLDLTQAGELTDRYYDDMGEALLAIAEGHDPREAVLAYRRREYVPRHRTQHIGDRGEDARDEARLWDAVMPTSPSAEDEALGLT